MGDTYSAAVVAKYSKKDFADEKSHESVDSLELVETLSKDIPPESEETNL